MLMWCFKEFICFISDYSLYAVGREYFHKIFMTTFWVMIEILLIDVVHTFNLENILNFRRFLRNWYILIDLNDLTFHHITMWWNFHWEELCWWSFVFIDYYHWIPIFLRKKKLIVIIICWKKKIDSCHISLVT